MEIFKGVGTAIVTPFDNGRIDYNAYERLLEWQIASNINALIVCGTTGEASTLSTYEKIKLVEYTIEKVAGRIPVIAGSGCNCTSEAMFLSKEMEDIGVNGLLVVTPYYNKCSEEGLIDYFESIASYVSSPIIMYSVKSRTAVNISPNVVKKLSKVDNIIGIKEASNDLSQICSIAQYCSKDFHLYAGNDDNTLPILALGGSGVISTCSNILPKQFAHMCQLFFDGDLKGSLKLQLELKPIIDVMFSQVNPIPIKAALNYLNKIKLEYRSPLVPPNNKEKFEIYNAVEKYVQPIKK